MPDDSVPCLEPSKSWCRWAFELSHLTFVNPHRTAGETFQILRRLGYWKSMVKDLERWLYACRAMSEGAFQASARSDEKPYWGRCYEN